MLLDRVFRTGRRCVGNAQYCFLREHCSGLDAVNCFTFLWALFRNDGVDIPRDFCGIIVHFPVVPLGQPLEPGNLLLTSAAWGGVCVPDKKLCCVGHFGLVTDAGTVLHASARRGTVVEEPLALFLDPVSFCGALNLRAAF